jgi:hypothetical protein
VSTDNIRRQAKLNAWYPDPDEQPSVFPIKNPFAKHRAPLNSRTNTLDAQETGNSGLRRTATDFDGRNRQQGLLEFKPLTRRGTAPNASSRIDQSRGLDIDPVCWLGGPVQEQVPMELDENTAKDSQSSETVAVEEKPTHQHPQDFVLRKPDDKGNGNEAKGDYNNGKEKPVFTWRNQIQGTIFNSYINILLLFCEPTLLVAVLFLLMPDSTRRNCTLLYSRQPYCRFRC